MPPQPSSARPLHDHRRLGRELELFDSDPLIGAGLPYWLPAGAAVRQSVEDYLRQVERRAGYQHVYSPVLAKRELYELSGHWAHYRDDMYPPMDVGGEQLVLRPSLCPHHALVYRSRQRSARDLPLRIAELGGMFRAEASGVVAGLTRVRAIQLNDAHIFCTRDQVAAEVATVLDMVDAAYGVLGIAAHRVRLSLRGAGSKYVDDAPMWDHGEQALADVLDARGVAYDREHDEGAFYGPKIDVQVVDSAGREATLSTVQLDFFQPARFDLRFVAPGGGTERPVMIHRSVVGSLERVVAQLVEVHGGAFPAWLAPVQVAVLPVGEEQVRAAGELAARCVARDLRVHVEGPDHGTLAARVRRNRLVPYVAVLGAREVADGGVALRVRGGGPVEASGVEAAVEAIADVVARRSAVLRA
jgi:threonyl-tRNA synthetase